MTSAKQKLRKLTLAYRNQLRDLLIAHRAVVQEELYQNLRERIGSAPKAPKAKRGARHCTACGKKGHDARTCPQKGKGKKATITVLKAAA